MTTTMVIGRTQWDFRWPNSIYFGVIYQTGLLFWPQPKLLTTQHIFSVQMHKTVRAKWRPPPHHLTVSPEVMNAWKQWETIIHGCYDIYYLLTERDSLGVLYEGDSLLLVPLLLVQQAKLIHGEGNQVVVILDPAFTVETTKTPTPVRLWG